MDDLTRELDRAYQLLISGGHTFAAVKDGEELSSDERGIRPLLWCLDSGKDLTGSSVADKVVGMAPAYIYKKLAIKEIFAPVMTDAAKALLEGAGIDVYYDTLTESVMNDEKTDICPMEKAVKDAKDPDDAVARIRETIGIMKDTGREAWSTTKDN